MLGLPIYDRLQKSFSHELAEHILQPELVVLSLPPNPFPRLIPCLVLGHSSDCVLLLELKGADALVHPWVVVPHQLPEPVVAPLANIVCSWVIVVSRVLKIPHLVGEQRRIPAPWVVGIHNSADISVVEVVQKR